MPSLLIFGPVLIRIRRQKHADVAIPVFNIEPVSIFIMDVGPAREVTFLRVKARQCFASMGFKQGQNPCADCSRPFSEDPNGAGAFAERCNCIEPHRSLLPCEKSIQSSWSSCVKKPLLYPVLRWWRWIILFISPRDTRFLEDCRANRRVL